MTADEFNIFWTSNFSDTVPIQHQLRHAYPDRWFRIHSLPDSKRYADNQNDWDILLNRHNSLTTDLFGDNANVLLVTGDYSNVSFNEVHTVADEVIFESYSFTTLDNIDLHKLHPNEHDNGEIYRPAFAKTVWHSNKHNALLQGIAKDEVRAFFIAIDSKIIVAPYDGGMDIILKDTTARDIYKHKYRNWLSYRQDGL